MEAPSLVAKIQCRQRKQETSCWISNRDSSHFVNAVCGIMEVEFNANHKTYDVFHRSSFSDDGTDMDRLELLNSMDVEYATEPDGIRATSVRGEEHGGIRRRRNTLLLFIFVCIATVVTVSIGVPISKKKSDKQSTSAILAGDVPLSEPSPLPVDESRQSPTSSPSSDGAQSQEQQGSLGSKTRSPTSVLPSSSPVALPPPITDTISPTSHPTYSPVDQLTITPTMQTIPMPSTLQSDMSVTTPPTVSPVIAPTLESPLKNRLILLSRTGGREFGDPNSYESKAWEWVQPQESSLPQDKLVQRYALACLYYSTHQVSNAYMEEIMPGFQTPTWANASGWLDAGVDECNWYGLSCNMEDKVDYIDLERNSLSGSLPFELSYLGVSLRVLFLDSNWFFNNGTEGHAFLEGLTRLTNFSAHDSFLQHRGIPTQFAALTSLQSLDVSYVSYHGAIEDSTWVPYSMPSLRYMDISGNAFHSPLPPALILQPSLNAFFAGNSDLTGNVHDILPHFAGVVEVWMDQNPLLTGTLPANIGALTAMLSLSLTECSIQGSIPESIGNLVHMKQMWLYENQLTGTLPASLGNLSNLRTLQVQGNQLVGAVPDPICPLTRWFLKSFKVDCSLSCSCCSCCGDQCGRKSRRLRIIPKKAWLQ